MKSNVFGSIFLFISYYFGTVISAPAPQTGCCHCHCGPPPTPEFVAVEIAGDSTEGLSASLTGLKVDDASPLGAEKPVFNGSLDENLRLSSAKESHAETGSSHHAHAQPPVEPHADEKTPVEDSFAEKHEDSPEETSDVTPTSHEEVSGTPPPASSDEKASVKTMPVEGLKDNEQRETLHPAIKPDTDKSVSESSTIHEAQ